MSVVMLHLALLVGTDNAVDLAGVNVLQNIGPAGTQLLVRLMHAPPVRAVANTPPLQEFFYSEDHEVVVVAADPQAGTPAHLALLENDQVERPYVKNTTASNNLEHPLLRDAVVILGTDQFVPSFGTPDSTSEAGSGWAGGGGTIPVDHREIVRQVLIDVAGGRSG